MVKLIQQTGRSRPQHSQWLEFELIGLVAASPNSSQRTLADRLGVSLGTVNGMMKRMIGAGFLAKCDDSGARRQRLILTAEGRRRLSKVAPSYLSARTAEIERATRLLTDLQGVISRRANA